MASSNGIDQSILWDDVQVLTVNHHRHELFLSQNVGGSPGELRIKEPTTMIRADMRDPLRVLDMAVRYAIRYDMLARVLDADVVAVLEQIGVKDFLERIISLTTEQMRRNRFEGLSYFEFTVNEGKNGASAEVRSEDEADDYDEPDDEEDEAVPTSVAAAVKAPRRRRTSNSSN